MHSLSLKYLAEIGVPHIELDTRNPIRAGAQIIEPFQFTVGLDEHVQRRVVPETFAEAFATQDNSRDVAQIANLKVRRSVEPPIVKNWDQKIGARRRSIELPNRSNRVVCEMRQQVVNAPAAQGDKMTMHSQWVRAKRDYRENAVGNLRLLQQLDPTLGLIVGTPAEMVNPDDIVDLLGAIQTDTDRHLVLPEYLSPSLVQQGAVGLNAKLDVCHIVQEPPCLATPIVEFSGPD